MREEQNELPETGRAGVSWVKSSEVRLMCKQGQGREESEGGRGLVLRIGEYKGHRDEEIAPQIVKSSVDSPRGHKV